MDPRYTSAQRLFIELNHCLSCHTIKCVRPNCLNYKYIWKHSSHCLDINCTFPYCTITKWACLHLSCCRIPKCYLCNLFHTRESEALVALFILSNST